MKTILTFLLSVLTCFTSYARDFDDIEITATNASGKVFMLQGAGGNIGVLATDSGLLLVDENIIQSILTKNVTSLERQLDVCPDIVCIVAPAEDDDEQEEDTDDNQDDSGSSEETSNRVVGF